MEKDKNGAFGWLLSRSGERKREFVLSVILAALITVPLGAVCYALMMFGYEGNYKRTVNATKALNAVTTEYIRLGKQSATDSEIEEAAKRCG